MRRVWIAGFSALVVAILAFVFIGLPEKPGRESNDLSVSTYQSETGRSPTGRDVTGGNAEGNDFGNEERFAYYLNLADDLPPMPRSLDGTQVDGELRADAHGNLIIEPDIRRVFDYFLSTVGEDDIEQVKARIALHLAETLPDSAARQAWELFERYEAYGAALEALPQHDGTVAGMGESLKQRQQLRQEWLGQNVAEAFYSFDDAFDNYTLARMAVLENDSLDADEKAARLQALEDDLPAPLREVRERANQPVRVSQDVAALREAGASEYEIRAVREAALGREAAERLEALDRQREQWDRRYADYRRAVAEIAASGLAQEDQEREVARLREATFDEQEQRRVQALDRMQDGQ
ncbi:lipase secretion chaperone [Isoalcanivorax indicus]|uniref:lipase secretion chaperone n=1 Tax=Isoalcanivorax indicus TaxID=2202653 RepID=UPI000DBA7A33|nr:lipase secretion chaperone [Isoalcanivorax indicus]